LRAYSEEDYLNLANEVITVVYWEHYSSLEIADLVDELGNHFAEVRTERRRAPAMAQTVVDVGAAILVFAGLQVLSGFLQEIGKDGWRKAKDKLYHLYTNAQARGGYRYMRAFELETAIDGVRVTLRIAKSTMIQKELETALQAAQLAIAADGFVERVKSGAENRRFILGWDPESEMWIPTKLYAESGL
jgi:hypothetical protein